MTFSLFDVAFVASLGGGAAYDADALAYITAVEAADAAAGQSGGLEAGVKDAINDFVVGCKADGIWDAIKASCILAGARTLDGCLVPLVGAAPTNVGPFVSGDYDRETGLLGNGSTKYLNSNRNNNADPQNSQHLSFYRTSAGSGNRSDIGAGIDSFGTSAHFTSGTTGAEFFVCRSSSYSPAHPTAINATGLLGVSRSSSAQTTERAAGSNYADNYSAQSPLSGSILVFARGTTASPNAFSNARLAFYSIGEALDLALLDARVTALIAAIGAAIP